MTPETKRAFEASRDRAATPRAAPNSVTKNVIAQLGVAANMAPGERRPVGGNEPVQRDNIENSPAIDHRTRAMQMASESARLRRKAAVPTVDRRGSR